MSITSTMASIVRGFGFEVLGGPIMRGMRLTQVVVVVLVIVTRLVDRVDRLKFFMTGVFLSTLYPVAFYVYVKFFAPNQIAQAEANKFFVEWWHQSKWRRTGVLWWNLRDGWPIFSDAVVDYYNRKKLAYWYLQRSQADVCAIIGEANENGQYALLMTNDTLEDKCGHITVTDADTEQVLIESDYSVSANSISTTSGELSAGKQAMWLIEWTVEEETCRNHYLLGQPPFNLYTYKRWLTALEIPSFSEE